MVPFQFLKVPGSKDELMPENTNSFKLMNNALKYLYINLLALGF